MDVCGLDGGAVFLDRSLPTVEALADPSLMVSILADAHRAAPLDMVAGPSGYGLPMTEVHRLSDDDIRLAYLAVDGEAGGIGGLRALIRALAELPISIVLTPGVIHLASVPAYRKVNRVDMGTADKLCVAALAIREHMVRYTCPACEASLVLLELGGAFTAALAIENGQIVDGAGGTSGPLGARAAGALDGEVAFLAGSISKGMLFSGGAATIAGAPDADALTLANPSTDRGWLAWNAYLESAVKAVVSMTVSAPRAREVIISGRFARIAGVRDELARRLAPISAPTVHALSGFGTVAMQAAQGAALIADGLAGGASAALVDTLGIRHASGTIFDHLHVITPAAARMRLDIA